MKREMRRKLMAVSGVMICGASVGIFQKIALGTDPFTCFVTGIANVFGSTYSTWYVILTGIMLAGVAVLHRHYIGFATLINLFLTGMAADVMPACWTSCCRTRPLARAACSWHSMSCS